MDYTRMSWQERQRMVKDVDEQRIDAVRNRAVSGAELTNRTMDAALHGAPVEALELERATGEGMPDAPAWRQGLPVWTDGEFGPGRKVPEFTGELLSWSVQPCTGEGR